MAKISARSSAIHLIAAAAIVSTAVLLWSYKKYAAVITPIVQAQQRLPMPNSCNCEAPAVPRGVVRIGAPRK